MSLELLDTIHKHQWSAFRMVVQKYGDLPSEKIGRALRQCDCGMAQGIDAYGKVTRPFIMEVVE